MTNPAAEVRWWRKLAAYLCLPAVAAAYYAPRPPASLADPEPFAWPLSGCFSRSLAVAFPSLALSSPPPSAPAWPPTPPWLRDQKREHHIDISTQNNNSKSHSYNSTVTVSLTTHRAYTSSPELSTEHRIDISTQLRQYL
eukprot:9187890-Pyramimonas_sp.AAC.1